MICFRQIHFDGERRPPRRIIGFHECLTGMPTIRVHDRGRHRGIQSWFRNFGHGYKVDFGLPAT